MSKKEIKILELITVKNEFDSMRVKLDNIKIFLDFEGFNKEYSKEINGIINLLSHLGSKMIDKIDKIILKK